MSIVVTGLRRSATSAMMYALLKAGVPIIGKSMADEHNPTGYWETGLTTRKDHKADKVIKVFIEYVNEDDKAIVMRRNIEDIAKSMVKCGMTPNVGKMRYDFLKGINLLKDYIIVDYEDIVRNPEIEMKRVCEFIGQGDYRKGAKIWKSTSNRQ